MTHYRVVCYALQNFVTSHNNRLLIDASIDASLGQVSITRVVAHYKVCCYSLQNFVTLGVLPITKFCYDPLQSRLL